MKHNQLPGLHLPSGCFRLSTFIRAIWMAVALLHVWLVLRRLATGDWHGTMEIVRGLLCMAGVGYASLKFWRVATLFDGSPRRAFIFGLIMLIGHWMIAAPRPAEMRETSPNRDVASIIVTLPAVAAAFVLIFAAARDKQVSRLRLNRITDPFPLISLRIPNFETFYLSPQLFRRPPPLLTA